MARRLLMLGVALALAAGCGGGGSKAGGGGDTLSQDQFVSQANTICREGSQKITANAKEVQGKLKSAKSAQEQQDVVADVLDQTVQVYEPYLKRLHDLKPPANVQGEWDKFLGGIDKAFELIPDLADATRSADRPKLETLTTEFTQIAGDTRPFAVKYKLHDCLPENSQPSSSG